MNAIQGLRVRYEKLLSDSNDNWVTVGVSQNAINDIQIALGVCLPADFRDIAAFYSGGLLGDYSFVNVNGCFNVIDETIRLRKCIDLPLRFVVLAEPPESIIVMDTQNSPSIVWCDAVEVSKLDNKSFISRPDEWNTFTDYFAERLAEAEKEMTEDETGRP